MPVYLTPEEVAERCRVVRRTVYDWLREGKLRGRRAGRKWLISDEDVEQFLNAGTATGSVEVPLEQSSVVELLKASTRVKPPKSLRRR